MLTWPRARSAVRRTLSAWCLCLPRVHPVDLILMMIVLDAHPANVALVPAAATNLKDARVQLF